MRDAYGTCSGSGERIGPCTPLDIVLRSSKVSRLQQDDAAVEREGAMGLRCREGLMQLWVKSSYA
jgi:hypothetical protein